MNISCKPHNINRANDPLWIRQAWWKCVCTETSIAQPTIEIKAKTRYLVCLLMFSNCNAWFSGPGQTSYTCSCLNQDGLFCLKSSYLPVHTRSSRNATSTSSARFAECLGQRKICLSENLCVVISDFFLQHCMICRENAGTGSETTVATYKLKYVSDVRLFKGILRCIVMPRIFCCNVHSWTEAG